jgi:histone-lysine N-methyltransferase SETD8
MLGVHPEHPTTLKMYKNRVAVQEPQEPRTTNQEDQQRRSARVPTNRKIDAVNEAISIKILNNTEEGLDIVVLPEKGRCIFASKFFRKYEFICEYAGELINRSTALRREDIYRQDASIGSYMYFFDYQNKRYCIDATAESGRLGRLLNHSKNARNVSSRVFPINNHPHLILYATKDIEPGMELLYEYGDRSKKSRDDHDWINQ